MCIRERSRAKVCNPVTITGTWYNIFIEWQIDFVPRGGKTAGIYRDFLFYIFLLEIPKYNALLKDWLKILVQKYYIGLVQELFVALLYQVFVLNIIKLKN